METDIEKEVIAIISEVSGYEIGEITPDMKMVEDLDIDSIKAIEIVVAFEKRFKISIRDEDVPSIMTVREAMDLTSKLLKEEN